MAAIQSNLGLYLYSNAAFLAERLVAASATEVGRAMAVDAGAMRGQTAGPTHPPARPSCWAPALL